MILKYVGSKPLPYVLQTPIPYLSRSYHEGELAFTPEAEVKKEWADYLLEHCAGAFERVGGPIDSPEQAPRLLCQADIEQILKYVGKRFSGKAGKWNAVAFIKKHHAEEILGLRKLQIMTAVIHWELVPIALADVKAGDLPDAWNKGKKNHYAAWNKGKKMKPDAVTEESVGVPDAPIPAMQEG